MPVKRRISKRREEISPAALAYLRDEPLPADANPFEVLMLEYGEDREIALLWAECRKEILSEWIVKHPGTRPNSWWRFDAPAPARQRVGGVGDPQFHAPPLWYGVPRSWCRAGTPGAYYGMAIDPAHPPIFESQATFLERHNLLLPGERRRLTAADFEPERVVA